MRVARTMPIRTGKPTCQERSARTVVWRGFGKVLVARHDAQVERPGTRSSRNAKTACVDNRALSPAYCSRQRRDLRVGQRAARSHPSKGGLPFRCLARHLIAAQGHRRAHPLRRGSYERATSSCFSTMEDRFGKRRADVHRGRDGRSCNGRDDCKEIPSLSMADIQKAMKYLEAQRRLARS